MKNHGKLILIVLFGAMTVISSCKKDTATTASSSSGGEYLTAKIDGNNFEAMTTPQSTVTAKVVESNGVKTLLLQGSDTKGNAINITILAYDGTGTYYSGDDAINLNTMTYIEILKNDSWSSTSSVAVDNGIAKGVLNVAKDDGDYIEGTFSFDGWNDTKGVKKITDGKFRAQLE